MQHDTKNNKMKTIFEDSFSEEVWASTYKDYRDNSVDDTFMRVATAIASVEETKELKESWGDSFFDLLQNFKGSAGGRILSNAGTEWGGTTLMNCFVGSKATYDQDSLDGILKVLNNQCKTLKSEGGWGMNFSFIRPRGAFINGIGVESPGSVTYMELFDKSSALITSGSGLDTKNKKAKGKIRKGAMMGVMDVWHPDIEEFISAKLTPGRLSKFNISVNCSDEFMEKVIFVKELRLSKADPTLIAEYDKWHLEFPDTKHEKYKEIWNGDINYWKSFGYPVNVVKTVSVTELWNKIIKSTYTRNDPGVLFLDRANATQCWNYGGIEALIKATNPCGEQCLPFGAVCNLFSFNLTQFIDETNNCFDLEKLQKYIAIAVRFLDDINSYTNAPLPEYIESIRKRRRIGLGVLGWGSALYMLKTRFGSKKAEAIKEELMRTFTHAAVKASIDLAKERGMFAGCDPEKHANHPFWQQIQLDDYTLGEMRQYGIRNSALFSIQPTGNTSVLCNIVSGGLEPVFMPEYIRTVIVNSVPNHIKNVTPKYWEGEFFETSLFKFTKEGGEQILRGVDTGGVVYKIDKNRGLTREVLCEDYAVRHLKLKGEWDASADWACTTDSLTVNDHLTDMKGFGKWIDSSMSKTVNVPNDYPFEDFENVYLDAYKTGCLKGITTYRVGTMTNVLAAKSDKDEEIEFKTSPIIKRPKELKAKVFHPTAKGGKFYVAVGLLNDKPFEVFVGLNTTNVIPIKMDDASIVKRSKGVYDLCADDFCYPLNTHSDANVDALTRMVSLSLHSGASLARVVEQLERTNGDMFVFAKVLARTLKRFIPDGTTLSEECPACGEALIRQEGCKRCTSCDYSVCG